MESKGLCPGNDPCQEGSDAEQGHLHLDRVGKG